MSSLGRPVIRENGFKEKLGSFPKDLIVNIFCGLVVIFSVNHDVNPQGKVKKITV